MTTLAELLIEVDIDADGVGIGIRRAADDVDDGFDRMEQRAARAGKGVMRAFGKELAVTGKPIAAVVATGFSAQFLGSVASGLASGAANLAHGFAAAVALLPAAALAGGIALGTLKLALSGVGDALKAGMAGDAEAFNAALEGLAPAARTVVRELVGLKGQVDSLKSTVQGNFFAPLIGEVKPLGEIYLRQLHLVLGDVAASMGTAATSVSGLLQTPQVFRSIFAAMSNAGEAVDNLVDGLDSLVAAFIPLVTVGASFLPGLTDGFGSATARLAEFMQEAERTGQLAAFIQGGIDSIRQLVDTAQQIGRIFADLGAIGAVAFGGISGAGGGLLDTLERLVQNLRDFVETAQGSEAVGEVMETIAAVVNMALGTLQRLVEVIGRAFAPHLPAILDFVEALSNLKSAVLDTGFDALEPVLVAIGNVLGNVILPALTGLATSLAANQPVLQGIGIAILTLMVPAFVAWAISAGTAALATLALWAPIILIGAAIAALAALVIIHFDTIKNAIAAVFNWVANNSQLLLAILTGPIGAAVYLIVTHWDTIKAAAGAAIDWIQNTWNTGFEWIKGLATGAKDWVVGRFNDLVSFVTGLPGAIASAASGMWDGITSAFKSAVNTIIRAWNGLEFRIPGFDPPGPGPTFGGFTLGLPDIPQLATGGVIKATAGGTIFRGGEGGQDEAIVPLPRGLRAMTGGGGGTTVNLYVQGSIRSDRDLVKIVRDEIDRGGFGGLQ